jgi:exodeoxyribonuclease-3
MKLEEEYNVPVILCGDLNCTHTDIDIYNPKMHKNTPGVSKQERDELQLTLDAGFVDSFRHVHPEEQKYTYWSNFHHARERNMGWRIDYVLVSHYITDKIISADCLTEYYGSDHCPVSIELNIITDDSAV